jgi:preprotein translocase subunit SecB
MSEEAQFALQRIYIKDLSFEAPSTPHIFKGDWTPEVNLELNNNTTKVDEDFYEVVLRVTVTVTNEEKVAFIAEVHQAGLFMIKHTPQDQLAPLLGSYCPSVLFPFVREAIADVVNKGSFPQLLLAPINFDVLYRESLKSR